MAHPDVIDDIDTREDMPVSYTFWYARDLKDILEYEQ